MRGCYCCLQLYCTCHVSKSSIWSKKQKVLPKTKCQVSDPRTLLKCVLRGKKGTRFPLMPICPLCSLLISRCEAWGLQWQRDLNLKSGTCVSCNLSGSYVYVPTVLALCFVTVAFRVLGRK